MAGEETELEWEVSGEAPERVLSQQERERRAMFALMQPVANAAFGLKTPLEWLKGAIQTATFAAGRSRGVGLREVGESLDVSISKVALLSKDYKQGMFGSSDRGAALELTIERMLSSEPLTLARLNQVLPEVSISDIEEALDRLEASERISCEGEGDFALYHLELDADGSAWDKLLLGLDGLRGALESVTAGVLARAGVHDRETGGAGVSSQRLRLPKDALGHLEELLCAPRGDVEHAQEALRGALERASALDAEDTIEVEVATFWRVISPAGEEAGSGEEG